MEVHHHDLTEWNRLQPRDGARSTPEKVFQGRRTPSLPPEVSIPFPVSISSPRQIHPQGKTTTPPSKAEDDAEHHASRPRPAGDGGCLFYGSGKLCEYDPDAARVLLCVNVDVDVDVDVDVASVRRQLAVGGAMGVSSHTTLGIPYRCDGERRIRGPKAFAVESLPRNRAPAQMMMVTVSATPGRHLSVERAPRERALEAEWERKDAIRCAVNANSQRQWPWTSAAKPIIRQPRGGTRTWQTRSE
ncbi:hypothetical protein CMUS01_06233 [Colletotrichum musicola]|uniref:Uncharacterized protein n=1 Tax=Colletotrichum musicola TaxID=2175873 RepID=A0A8H6KMY9_9PEZI|nr:hypothetical protein CMUS01_06233 [Colletotrichum musicola]